MDLILKNGIGIRGESTRANLQPIEYESEKYQYKESFFVKTEIKIEFLVKNYPRKSLSKFEKELKTRVLGISIFYRLQSCPRGITSYPYAYNYDTAWHSDLKYADQRYKFIGYPLCFRTNFEI